MNRFNSAEGVVWNESAFNDGLLARIQGCGQHQCPTAEAIGELARESWLAGWDDANMDFTRTPQHWDTLGQGQQL